MAHAAESFQAKVLLLCKLSYLFHSLFDRLGVLHIQITRHSPRQLLRQLTLLLEHPLLVLGRLIHHRRLLHGQTLGLAHKEEERDEIGDEDGDVDKVELPGDGC